VNKKEFFASLNDVYCRLGTTSHGVGVVAIRPIPKGIDPFKNCDPGGDLLEIPAAELDACVAPEEAKQMVRDFCALQEGVYHAPNYGMDAIDKSFYLNHSKEPNMISPDHGETFIAARDITVGEELTADYDTYHESQHFERS
jgi:SET domain